jgi:hypothetical protein
MQRGEKENLVAIRGPRALAMHISFFRSNVEKKSWQDKNA